MPKKFTLIIVLFSTLTIAAQESKSNFGIKGGLTASKFSSDSGHSGGSTIEYKSKYGFYLGGYFSYSVSDLITIQPELYFALQGAKPTFEVEFRPLGELPYTAETRIDVTESVIQLPIIGQVNLIDKFYFELGPQIGYIVSRKEILQESAFEELEEEVDVSNPDYNAFDFGIVFGVGLNISEKLALNLRYNYGLIKRENTIKSSVGYLGLEYNL